MTTYILIALLVGIAVGIWFQRGRRRQDYGVLKEGHKDKILTALQREGKLANDDVQKLLEISDATATRYMEELEEEGKVVQVGTTGRYVHYVLAR